MVFREVWTHQTLFLDATKCVAYNATLYVAWGHSMANELQALEEPYPEEIAEALSHYPKIDGQLIALFRTFANSRRFLEKAVPNLLDQASPLALKEREIVILRITANNKCEYEWGVHVAVFGSLAGFTENQILDTCCSSADPALWSDKEHLLLCVIDQFCSTGNVTESNLAAFQHYWTVEQQLEIIALCGTYKTVSLVANLARLPCELFAARFPGTEVTIRQ